MFSLRHFFLRNKMQSDRNWSKSSKLYIYILLGLSKIIPYNPCRVYLLTFSFFFKIVNVGNYTSPMDAMGIGHITKSEESCLDFVLRPMMDNPLA